MVLHPIFRIPPDLIVRTDHAWRGLESTFKRGFGPPQFVAFTPRGSEPKRLPSLVPGLDILEHDVKISTATDDLGLENDLSPASRNQAHLCIFRQGADPGLILLVLVDTHASFSELERSV